MYLLSVKPSTRPNKKYMATYCLCQKKNACGGSNHKIVHFGDSKYEDYTIHKDKDRRKNYRTRAKSFLTDDPTTPARLSYDLLWGDSTSLQVNVDTYRKKYNL